MRELHIAGRRIADDTPAFVVAELGTNHGGSVDQARALIAAAAEAGADAVKLQKRDNRTLFTRELYDSPYVSEHAYGATYGEHREALEFGWPEYQELQAYAESLGLVFFATAFDVPSADFLQALGVPCFKIASGDLTNLLLIRHVARLGKPVILSTGGGTFEDVDAAWWAAEETAPVSPPDLVLLQCTASYPAVPEELNLRVIETYREEFPGLVIGLSDHQDGISLAPVAYALGARIFEKHFTLSRSWKGSDQAFSLEPEGLRRMVQALRATRAALGDGVKRVYDSEREPIRKMAKSIVAARPLAAGHVLEASDLALRSPGGGLPPYEWDRLIGLRLREALLADGLVTREVVQPWD